MTELYVPSRGPMHWGKTIAQNPATTAWGSGAGRTLSTSMSWRVPYTFRTAPTAVALSTPNRYPTNHRLFVVAS